MSKKNEILLATNIQLSNCLLVSKTGVKLRVGRCIRIPANFDNNEQKHRQWIIIVENDYSVPLYRLLFQLMDFAQLYLGRVKIHTFLNATKALFNLVKFLEICILTQLSHCTTTTIGDIITIVVSV